MNNLVKQGIKQALSISIYCGLVGTMMQNGDKIFGDIDNSFMGPVAFLTMFAVSVLICALLVFKKPYELFSAGKKQDAVNVVVYTAASLFVILIFLFALIALF